MDHQGMELSEDVFKGKPNSVRFACVDYDRELKFSRGYKRPVLGLNDRWKGGGGFVHCEPHSDYAPIQILERD